MHSLKSFPNLNKIRQMHCYHENPMVTHLLTFGTGLLSITSLVNSLEYRAIAELRMARKTLWQTASV